MHITRKWAFSPKLKRTLTCAFYNFIFLEFFLEIFDFWWWDKNKNVWISTRVQWVHKPINVWDITFCTHGFWGSKYCWHRRILRLTDLFYRTDCTRRSKFLTHAQPWENFKKLINVGQNRHSIVRAQLRARFFTTWDVWLCS